MRGFSNLYSAILVLAVISLCQAVSKLSASVRLANVKTLTLRDNQKTTARRVSAIPQLKCIGGNAKDLYKVDVMRCKNQGSDYDDESIQWTCTASLPIDFKLGSTDVICEGYSSPEDPFILKGSCGVEYRLFLTAEGEAKYGHRSENIWRDFQKGATTKISTFFFWVLFVAVAGYIIYSALQGQRPDRIRRGNWGGWGGGGGDNDDPPPPYDWQPPRKPKTTAPRSTATGGRTAGNRNANAQQGWRPGFWTGALGGAGLGYLAANRGRTQQETQTQPRSWGAGRWGSNTVDRGFGQNDGQRSGTPSPSTSRYESQGFGSTTRR